MAQWVHNNDMDTNLPINMNHVKFFAKEGKGISFHFAHYGTNTAQVKKSWVFDDVDAANLAYNDLLS